jgi:hypothetical protein
VHFRINDCVTLNRQLEEAVETIKECKLKAGALQESLTGANLQRIDNAEQIQELQSENKKLKVRIDQATVNISIVLILPI